MPVSLQGTVKSQDGSPVHIASVRLVGTEAQFGNNEKALVGPAPTAIVWTRTITGFAGNRWACWEQFLLGKIQGITWSEFSKQVGEQNSQLAEDGNIFKADQSYKIPEQASVLSWTRPITDFSGSRWDAWSQLVKDQVQGLTWSDFSKEVVSQNPTLTEDSFIFDDEKFYRLPENIRGEAGIVWARDLTGFAGSRWDAWEKHVKETVSGITWQDFLEEVALHNPTLSEDGHVFRAEKSYVMPENRPETHYYLFAWSDSSGRYGFQSLTEPGTYTLIVQAAGFAPYRERLTIDEGTSYNVVLPPAKASQTTKQPTPVKPTPTVDKKGFVQTSGTRFTLNGQPFRFIGANVRGLLHYGDGRLLSFSRSEHADIQLDAARQMGARVVRIFAANRHGNTQEAADRLEQALARAAARDQYLIIAFTDVHHDTGFNVPGDDRFYSADGRLNRDWFAGGYKENYLPFVEHLVRRFRNHPRIFAWELGNELKAWVPGQILPDLFIQFAQAVSNRIRELDPVHLIATGVINNENLGCNSEQADRLSKLPNIDFLTAHVYHGVVDGASNAQEELHNQGLEAQRAERDADRAQRFQKPFVIEEIGFCGGDRVQQTRDHLGKWFNQKGAAGFMQWGLMATDDDMGDGDFRFGMDRKFHGDFDGLMHSFSNQAKGL